MTTSKDSSEKSSCCAFIFRKSARQPNAARFFCASSIMPADMSMPVTSCPMRVSSTAKKPAPVPTSRTRSGFFSGK